MVEMLDNMMAVKTAALLVEWLVDYSAVLRAASMVACLDTKLAAWTVEKLVALWAGLWVVYLVD